jgi:RNA polymerase sigma-70 factor (ECF subfamily)
MTTASTLLRSSDRPATNGHAEAVCSHRPYLIRFASRRLRDSALVEDVVQDTLLAALQGEALFAGNASLRTWLTGILQRRIADSVRQASRRPCHVAATDDASEDETPGWQDDGDRESGAIDWVDPQRRLESRQFLAALENCLRTLPPASARLFTLREIDGASNEEAAAALGLSLRDCALALHRARSSVRDRLARHAEVCA